MIPFSCKVQEIDYVPVSGREHSFFGDFSDHLDGEANSPFILFYNYHNSLKNQ